MANVSIEQRIMERVRQMSEAQKQRVLAFVMHASQQPPVYSARDLLQLPAEERERLVAAAFEAAADEDFEIFESYAEEDLDA
jgi:hypothetical protein